MDKEIQNRINDAKARYGKVKETFTPLKENLAVTAERLIKARDEFEATAPRCPGCGEIRIHEDYCLNCERIAEQKIKDDKIKAEKLAFNIKRLGGEKGYYVFTREIISQDLLNLCLCYPKRNLFIYGMTGTGKSHLGTALLRDNPLGHVYKPEKIFSMCRGLKEPGMERSAVDRLVNMECLMIDDLGLRKLTDKSYEVLYDIIDGRDMKMKGGLIVTSNLMFDELADLIGNDRITSRLSGISKVIVMPDDIDHRQEGISDD